MATTGSERGLTLRSPGRFLATADRLVELYRDAPTRRPAAARRASSQAWIDAEAYRLADVLDRDRASSRASAPGAESSLTKLFWSELDVRLHETALALLGPHAELLDGDDAAWMKGYQFALAGPDLRRHQRDPAQRGRRARARPAEEVARCASPSPTTSSRSATRCATCSRRSARPRCVRAAWTNDDGRSAGLWRALAEMGVVGLLAPEADGGLGLDELDLVLLLEETGRAALPEPIVETAAVARAARRDRARRRGRRRSPIAASGTPYVPYAEPRRRAACSSGDERPLVVRAADATLDAAAVGRRRRRLFDVAWTPSTADASAVRRRPRSPFDRGALGAAAQLVGLADACSTSPSTT